jgi:hypothetical protein
MKLSARKYGYLLAIVVTLLLLGYYRDFVFRTINSMLQARDYETSYHPPFSMKFMENFSYNGLINLKWILTLMFSFLYLLVALITLKILFSNRRYTYVTIGVYVALTMVSGLFMLCGLLLESTSARMYEFARYLMGMAQSPIVLMILIPAFKLSGQEPNNMTN